MTKLKLAVTRYFSARKRELQALNGRRIRRNDDFFELYVLTRLAKALGATPEQARAVGRRRVFTVATSPTERWVDISYMRAVVGAKTYGLRTGLSVGAISGPGTAELDVVLLDLATTLPPGRVPAASVAAGFECKAHRRVLQQPHAHEALGKATRVFGMPVQARVAGATRVSPYCLVSLSGTAPSAQAVMQHFGIVSALASTRADDELDPHVVLLVATL
ncbi:MAG: hypothetical protein E6J91_18610 [Deltaproteobacteria bacterium]|nr:MAG: hypothetical protein E6J91_18610 [Deltaproteobacteria bacterium]